MTELQTAPLDGYFRPALNLEELAQGSLHRYLEGAGWCVMHIDVGVWVFCCWARLSESSVREFLCAVACALSNARPYVSVFDGRFISGIDPTAFGLMGEFLARHAKAFNRFNRRHAVIRSDGLVGAANAGFYSIFPSPKNREVEIFDAWTGVEEWLEDALPNSACRSEHWTECRKICERPLAGDPTWLAIFQAQIGRDLLHCNLQNVSRRIGISPRTLQRRLTHLGTTFQAQLAIARVRAAKNWIVRGETSMTQVALEVGFSCSQNLSRQFRRITGETPTKWRERQSLPEEVFR